MPSAEDLPNRATDPKGDFGGFIAAVDPDVISGVKFSAVNVMVDIARAVLVNQVSACLVRDTPPTFGLQVEGRINNAHPELPDSYVKHLYLMGADGAAAFVAEVIHTSLEVSPDFAREFRDNLQFRMEALDEAAKQGHEAVQRMKPGSDGSKAN